MDNLFETDDKLLPEKEYYTQKIKAPIYTPSSYKPYIKSLYTVLYNPSCIKITMMGVTRFRYHHRIDWKKAVPMIINEKYKKV